MPRTATLTETCPACDTTFAVDRDEDGKTELPTMKCANLNCPVHLCPCCPQFKCAGCDQTFCLEHAIEEDQHEPECTCTQTDVDQSDASWCFAHNPRLNNSKPSLFCAACLEESEATDWPEIPKIEPVTAVAVSPNIPEWSGSEVAG